LSFDIFEWPASLFWQKGNFAAPKIAFLPAFQGGGSATAEATPVITLVAEAVRTSRP